MMGPVRASAVLRVVTALKNHIMKVVYSFTINELIVRQTAASTSLWLMPNYRHAKLSVDLIMKIQQTLRAVKEFAMEHLHIDSEAANKMHIGKLDITQDYKGSFLPDDPKESF